ncbi:MAG: hypothetical protein MI784_11675 [Cytophagales bacterium]|nr:hypothetical protein [Cytophagales bacterium]
MKKKEVGNTSKIAQLITVLVIVLPFIIWGIYQHIEESGKLEEYSETIIRQEFTKRRSIVTMNLK